MVCMVVSRFFPSAFQSQYAPLTLQVCSFYINAGPGPRVDINKKFPFCSHSNGRAMDVQWTATDVQQVTVEKE